VSSIEYSPMREPKRRFAERWGVSTRTIDRWVQDGLLEEPEVINGRAYFRTDACPRGSRATEAAA
jgi:predicted site-specific integrase-resolvase